MTWKTYGTIGSNHSGDYPYNETNLGLGLGYDFDNGFRIGGNYIDKNSYGEQSIQAYLDYQRKLAGFYGMSLSGNIGVLGATGYEQDANALPGGIAITPTVGAELEHDDSGWGLWGKGNHPGAYGARALGVPADTVWGGGIFKRF